MAKYDPLRDYLAAQHEPVVELSFALIDRLVAGLPPSARTDPEWWDNDSTGSHTRAWRRARRHVVEVDLNGEWVRFSR